MPYPLDFNLCFNSKKIYFTKENRAFKLSTHSDTDLWKLLSSLLITGNLCLIKKKSTHQSKKQIERKKKKRERYVLYRLKKEKHQIRVKAKRFVEQICQQENINT